MPQPKMKKLSARIPADLMRALKIEAVMSGLTQEKLLEQVLRAHRKGRRRQWEKANHV